MEHTKYSPTSILKIVLGIIFGAWLMMGAPTGWIYDLWAGTGTEQGQTPDQFVSVVHTQADVEAAYTQNTPVTTAKEGLIECPLLRLRDSNEAGEHTFKKGIKRTVIIDEYVHIAYPTNPLRGFLLDFLAHGYYNSYDPVLAAMLSQPWSNNACRGYVIYAMENCGFSPNDIRRVVAELYEVFDFRSLEEAQQHFEESPY